MEENNNTAHFHFGINQIVYVLRYNKVFQCLVTAQFYKNIGSTKEKTYHLRRNIKDSKEDFCHVKEPEIFGLLDDLKKNIEVVEIQNIQDFQPFYEAGNAV